MIRTFPFEIPMTGSRPAVVDARPTRHPILVIHRTVETSGEWTLTHGPTGCRVHKSRKVSDCTKLASALAKLDPSGELLYFEDPEWQTAANRRVFEGDMIPQQALEIFAQARRETFGLSTATLLRGKRVVIDDGTGSGTLH